MRESTFPPAVATFPPTVATFPPAVATFPPAVATFPPAVATFPPALKKQKLRKFTFSTLLGALPCPYRGSQKHGIHR